MKDVDAGAIDAWVDKYCADHPLDLIVDATDALALEFSARQKRQQKK